MQFGFPHLKDRCLYVPVRHRNNVLLPGIRKVSGRAAWSISTGCQRNRMAFVAHLYGVQGCWIAISKRLQHVLAGNAKGAEAVQDGLVEAADLRKVQVDVQGIVVPIQSVESRQVLARPLLYDCIWQPPAIFTHSSPSHRAMKIAQSERCKQIQPMSRVMQDTTKHAKIACCGT